MIFILNPTLNITYSAATQVLDWSDLALLFWDKEVENEYYKKRSDILETAIKKLSDKSIHGKIETLMYIKNKIDFYCNNNINITSTGYTNKVSNNYMDKKIVLAPPLTQTLRPQTLRCLNHQHILE